MGSFRLNLLNFSHAAVETMHTEKGSKPTTLSSYKNPRVTKPLNVEAKTKITSVIIRKR